MIGIEFELNVGYKTIIYDLLKNINGKIYNVVEQEIIYQDCERYVPNILNKDDFNKYFNYIENYYVIFANIQIFDTQKDITNINNYADFIKSKCKLVLLVADAQYFEIYFNDEELKKTILKNVKELNIKYNVKTKENDGRTNFRLN